MVVTAGAGEMTKTTLQGETCSLSAGVSLPCSLRLEFCRRTDPYGGRSPSVIPSPVPVTPLPADRSCSEQSPDYFLLKLQKAINFSSPSLASGALK